MKTLYVSNDETVFHSEEECRRYETELERTVSVPVCVIQEAIRQATPYMVTARERRALAEKLKRYLLTL